MIMMSLARVLCRLKVLLLYPGVALMAFAWTTPQTRFSRKLYHACTSSKFYDDAKAQRQRQRRITMFMVNNDEYDVNEVGLNELQTLLRIAVEKEDFMEAGRLSDEIGSRLWKDNPPKTPEEKKARRKRLSWKGLGSAPWLVDRLDTLNYTFPTTIQINSMEAVNAILNDTIITGAGSVSGISNDDIDPIEEELSLEERVGRMMRSNIVTGTNKDMGIVISGSTGSGKTLAYCVPLLSTLSDSLFVRQRVRVGNEQESVGDSIDDLLARVSIVNKPEVLSSKSPEASAKTGTALSTLGTSDSTDVKNPLALIVVPTRELGIQTAMLLYQLVGGNVKKNAVKRSSNIDPDGGGKMNISYKGPKGIKIATILDDEESSFGLKLQTDVAITTPNYLSKLIEDEDIVPNKLRVIVYDEADLVLEETNPNDLEVLFGSGDDDTDDDQQSSKHRDNSRLTFLVGASVTESLGSLAVKSKVLPDSGKSYIATATNYSPLVPSSLPGAETNIKEDEPSILAGSDIPETATLRDLRVCLNPGLKHERCIAQNNTGLLVLARLLRKELRAYEEAKEKGGNIERPRVVIFFPTEKMAQESLGTMRDALWGDHKLCVLLPKSGVRPLAMMESFKKGEMSVMLATPNSVRGLDFPEVTHVYTLYLPMDDPREYVHLAGRTGRVGQTGSIAGSGGHVISILTEDDAPKMDILSKELGFTFTEIETPSSPSKPDIRDYSSAVGDEDEDDDDDDVIQVNDSNVDELRRYLEDTMTLVDLAKGIDDVDDSDETMNSNNDEDGYVDAEIIEDDEDDEQEYDAFQ